MDLIESLVADRPVVIFSKTTSCMSHSIILLISSFGANPTIYELDQIPEGQNIERALEHLGYQPSLPVVYIGGKLIGGAGEIMSLNVKNELGPLLVNAKAIWLWKKK